MTEAHGIGAERQGSRPFRLGTVFMVCAVLLGVGLATLLPVTAPVNDGAGAAPTQCGSAMAVLIPRGADAGNPTAGVGGADVGVMEPGAMTAACRTAAVRAISVGLGIGVALAAVAGLAVRSFTKRRA